MLKETKRKAFNFYRSYYDVFNELSDKDALEFIKALLDKQFLDIDPVDLTGMLKFAWISQTNSIEQQVKGYKSKTKDPMQGGAQPPTQPPYIQEEGKEEEKGKGEYTLKDKYALEKEFLNDWNDLRLKHFKKKSSLRVLDVDSRDIFNELIKHYSKQDMQNAIVGLFKQKKFPDNNTSMVSNPKHFLKFFNTYLTAFEDKNESLYGKKQTKQY